MEVAETSVSNEDWPAPIVPITNCPVMPIGTPVTDRLARFVNPPVPARPTANEPCPIAGIVSGVGSAVTLKFGLTTVKTGPVAGGATKVVTVTAPVVAPCGTVVVKVVPLALTVPTMAATPLNVIELLAAVGLKLVPVIVTTVPTGPVVGLMLVMLGGPGLTVSASVPGVRMGAVAVGKVWGQLLYRA